MDLKIISIGSLAYHPLWEERSDKRTAHATTSLITWDNQVILVNPSLPASILKAKLDERCGMVPDDITHVFLTSFRPDLRRSLPLFSNAEWLLSEIEREVIGISLVEEYKQAEHEADSQIVQLLLDEINILQRCKASPDNLGPHIDIFPLYGHTPGSSGLILSFQRYTVIICGDAIQTVEHLQAGQIPDDCYDLQQARESFADAVEIADLLVLGRDNIVVNSARGLF